MVENSKQLEGLEDKLTGHLSKNCHAAHFHPLKGVIINLAISACDDMDGELRVALEKALELWKDKACFGERGGNLIERSRKELDKSIKYADVDSKEAWLARLNYTSLHNMAEDDDTLLTLIFEYSTTNELDAHELSKILIDQFPDFNI
ncbi:hypothetical protein [Microbulbifer sp. TYP-18]|uniref:hypothetical protein n=1 Tax=Microbulbifer sp. TYP-18 TaxID=3230024 RepID=UPI0034C6B916